MPPLELISRLIVCNGGTRPTSPTPMEEPQDLGGGSRLSPTPLYIDPRYLGGGIGGIMEGVGE